MSRHICRVILEVLFCAAITTPAWAQDEFVATRIPPALLDNAHAVVRRYETIFTVKTPGESTTYERVVITVLDRQGDNFARLVMPYSKLNRVENLEAPCTTNTAN